MPRAVRKTKRYALGCGLVIATVAVAVLLSWPRERLLLEMAHSMCRIDMSSTARGEPKEVIYWLDGNRALIVATESEQEVRNGTNWKGHADLFDIGTRTRTRLSGLTNVLNARGLAHWGKPDFFQLSPNGTRLYWSASRARRLVERANAIGWNVEFGAATATVEGTELQEWRDDTAYSSFWADDHRFVQVIQARRGGLPPLRVYDVRNTHAARQIKPSTAGAATILASFGQNRPLQSDYSIDDNHVEITRTWFDVRSGKIVDHTDAIPLPTNARGGSRSDTSHQSAVPLLLLRKETPILVAWLHRVLPSLAVKPAVTEGLWVSRAGVQKLQEFGHISVRTDKENNIEGDQLEQFQSLPDGNQVSFVYRGMLYLMPITNSK